MAQEKLPIAREALGVGLRLPTKEVLQWLKEIASHPEISGYVVLRLEKWINTNERELKKQQLFEVYTEALQHFKERHKNICMQYDRPSPYLTHPDDIKDDFETLQQGLVNSALKVLVENKISEVSMDFAISDKAEIVRAFLAAGKEPPAAVVEALDTVSNYCLQEEGKLTKGGVIYETDGAKTREDAKGKPILADKEEVKDIFSDNLVEFLAENEITLQTVERPYPEKAPETKKPAPVEAVEKKAPEEEKEIKPSMGSR